MPPTPPDLERPYGSAPERDADREKLIEYWAALESLIDLAELSPDRWSPLQAGLVSEFPQSSEVHPAERDKQAQRLGRWRRLYEEELDLISDVRNRIVHRGIVTDPELKAATWLARQALATVTGNPPGRIDQVWARSIAGRASTPPT